MVALAAALAAGCESVGAEYQVRGIAEGVAGPVTIELAAGGATESVTLTADGPFAFATPLADREPYTVAIRGEAPCAITSADGASAGVRADGAIAGDDAEIAVGCSLLTDLRVSGATAPALAVTPGATDHAVDVSVLQQSAAVTAFAALPDTRIELAGPLGAQELASGEPSSEQPLALGETALELAVSRDDIGWSAAYRVAVTRGRKLAEYARGKPTGTDAGDELGFRVAVDGDTLAVGAPGEDGKATGVGGEQNDGAPDSGAVYVFRRAGTAWVQEAYLKASNTGTGDSFGFSLALSGDTLAVGAPFEDSRATGVDGDQENDAAEGSGAVYVFRRSGGAWAQEAYLKASNTDPFDRFGFSVAVDGDILAVGAEFEASTARGVNSVQTDNSATRAGAVYVFRRGGSAWAQEAYLKASNTEPGGFFDGFGSSVAVAGDTIAVGAPGEDSAATGVGGDQESNAADGSGAVYVFRHRDGAWAQEAYLKASNTGVSDAFGTSVSLSGETLAVGAHFEDSAATGVDGDGGDNGASTSGAAYVFRRDGTSWAQEAYLKPSNTGAGDRFGFSVAVSGDILAVGAFGERSAATGIGGDQADNSAPDSGAVYVFRRADAGWSQQTYLKASNSDAGDQFGASVALSGDTLAVGATLEDSTGGESGAVYVFH